MIYEGSWDVEDWCIAQWLLFLSSHFSINSISDVSLKSLRRNRSSHKWDTRNIWEKWVQTENVVEETEYLFIVLLQSLSRLHYRKKIAPWLLFLTSGDLVVILMYLFMHFSLNSVSDVQFYFRRNVKLLLIL